MRKHSEESNLRHTQRNNSQNCSGSWERHKKHPKQESKCKRCGFEKHTTQDGKCPALKALCGFCNITGHYETACISKRTLQKRDTRQGTGRRQNSTSPNRQQGNGSGGRRPTLNTNDEMMKSTHLTTLSRSWTLPMMVKHLYKQNSTCKCHISRTGALSE